MKMIKMSRIGTDYPIVAACMLSVCWQPAQTVEWVDAMASYYCMIRLSAYKWSAST